MPEIFASLFVASDQAVDQTATGALVDGLDGLGADRAHRQGPSLGVELLDAARHLAGGVPHSFGLGICRCSRFPLARIPSAFEPNDMHNRIEFI
jgi:hypothetical protein